jgi:nucleotide-binding universal stress UspA family protein
LNGTERASVEETSNRIVVGIDGSPDSEEALRWALREAATSGAEIDAVLVWSDPWALTGQSTLRSAGRDRTEHLQDTLAQVVATAVSSEHAGGVKLTQHLLAGNAAQVLAECSRGARMLVVGTTGLSGLRRLMLGSVSQRCAQLSGVPVVLVPIPDQHRDRGLTGTASGD